MPARFIRIVRARAHAKYTGYTATESKGVQHALETCAGWLSTSLAQAEGFTLAAKHRQTIAGPTSEPSKTMNQRIVPHSAIGTRRQKYLEAEQFRQTLSFREPLLCRYCGPPVRRQAVLRIAPFPI